MFLIKFLASTLLSLTFLSLTSSGEKLGHDEICGLEKNELGKDPCDDTKLLSCKHGRCQCSDPVNQIFGYRIEAVQPKGKQNPIEKLASSSTSEFKAFSPKSSPQYRKLYSCYSRVGGPCSLKLSDDGERLSSKQLEKFVAAEIEHYGYSKLTRCVQFGVCKRGKRSLFGGFVKRVDSDPGMGVCECQTGYKKTNANLCEDERFAAGNMLGGSIGMILVAQIISKMFL